MGALTGQRQFLGNARGKEGAEPDGVHEKAHDHLRRGNLSTKGVKNIVSARFSDIFSRIGVAPIRDTIRFLAMFS